MYKILLKLSVFFFQGKTIYEFIKFAILAHKKLVTWILGVISTEHNTLMDLELYYWKLIQKQVYNYIWFEKELTLYVLHFSEGR